MQTRTANDTSQTRVEAELGATRPGAQTPMLAAVAPARPALAQVGVRQVALWVGAAALTGAVFLLASGFVPLPGSRGERAHEAQAGFASSPTEAALIDPSRPALPTIYLVEPANCSALHLDRQTNRTSLEPCPDSGLALRLETDVTREDLAGLIGAPMQAADLGANQ
jgi:hypothetical protein